MKTPRLEPHTTEKPAIRNIEFEDNARSSTKVDAATIRQLFPDYFFRPPRKAQIKDKSRQPDSDANTVRSSLADEVPLRLKGKAIQQPAKQRLAVKEFKSDFLSPDGLGKTERVGPIRQLKVTLTKSIFKGVPLQS